jgi:hypothetical protein
MPVFNDDHFLATCIVINTVSSILGTFLWGYLADKIGNITTIGRFTLLGGFLGF